MMDQVSWFVDTYVQRNKELLIVILAILLIRLFMKKMPKKYVYCLWAIVGIRMLIPLTIPSSVSIYQFFPWVGANVQTEGLGQKGKEGLVEELPEETVAVKEAESLEDSGESMVSAWEGSDVGEDWLWIAKDEQGSDPVEVEWPEESQVIAQSDFPEEPVDLVSDAPGTEYLSDEDGGSDATVLESVSTSLDEKSSANVSEGKKLPLTLMLFALWLTGAMIVFTIGVVAYVRLRRLVRKAILVEDNVWECDGISTPFVLGVLRPRIYVPFHLGERQREMVLAHERQHLRRLDPYARLLAYLLLAIYWMNPLVWMSYFSFIRDQEMSCDEAVLAKLGTDVKKEYGMTLLSFATQERFVGFSPVAFGESDAEKRIKNVLNYKKPGFWIIVAGIAIVTCLGIVCLTTAKKKQDLGQGPEGQSEAGSPADADEMQDEETNQVTLLADLDGDGEKESVSVTDYARGKTTLNATLAGKALKELELQSVELIRTQCSAADLTGDGREELILLQSSPTLADSPNWPGTVLILQVDGDEWRQLGDELFYPETGEYVRQAHYPKQITDQVCIGVRIESMPDGERLHLLFGLSHGMDGVLRLDCTYQAQPKEGWQVQYAFTGHDYVTNVSLLQGQYHALFGISMGEEPEETIALEESLADKLFYGVPLQEFERMMEEGLGSSLTVLENGSFKGVDVRSGIGLSQTEICEFTGKFANASRVNGRLYLLTVDGLTYPEENNSYKQGDDQYVTIKPIAMANGDRFLLYEPGYPVAELPYKVIRALEDQGMPSWYNYALEELPCYALLNLDQGTVYLSLYLYEYVGQRMETSGLYGDLNYPCGSNGSYSFQSVTRLCADACGLFVQKVMHPMSESKSFTELVRNEQLAEYLEYKTKHFLHRFSDGGSWRLETKTWDYLTIDGARVLHVTCIPKYKNGSAKGSWGTIHFLIDMENGQHYIRDWYWDNPDSLDAAWRGIYSAEEGYDFWDHPVKYEEILKKDAQQIDLNATIFGLPVTCEETWNNPENPTHYERRYYYKDVLVGKSYGYGVSRDYVDDLDGDGITELICYTREMETWDYGEVTVFRRIGNSIYVGRLTEYTSLELPELDALSATRRITHHYDPDSNCLYLSYPVKGGDYKTVPFTYENMRFTEYSYVEPQVNSWKEAYANYVRRSEYQSYSLVYLDGDEIPELFCQDGGYPQRIVTYHDGKIKERYLERNAFLYHEKEGIYYTTGGNMGEFPMEIVELKDGEFIVLATGYQKSEYIANAESTAPDQMTEFVKYDWNGQSVTEEEYNQKIDAIMERKSAVSPKTLYTPDEILTLLGMEITSLAVG